MQYVRKVTLCRPTVLILLIFVSIGHVKKLAVRTVSEMT